MKSTFQATCSLPKAQPAPFLNWKKLWSLKAPKRTKMFLWRLCTNVLPTRENIKRRMNLNDDSCLLCSDFPEEPIHLFLKCPTTKALWFVACWGFRSEDFTASTSYDITNVVLNPPVPTLQVFDQGTISLSMAFTLEEIWRLRNSNLHSKSSFNLADSVLLIHRRVREYTEVSLKTSLPSLQATPSLWVPPPPGWIKVNVDAAWTCSKAALAVIARDSQGSFCNIWARTSSHRSPLQAEAEALLWAVEIAKREKWCHVCFEGDSKICFDALTSASGSSNWSIHASISNIQSLVQCFISFSFAWVNRRCNSAAHEAARCSLLSSSSFFYNKDFLPAPLAAVCKEGYPPL